MKNLITILFVFVAMSANAQTFTDAFDSNTLGWTEVSSKSGEAIIQDGVMRIEGKIAGGTTLFGYKQPSFIETHCYAGFDVKKNFEIKCEVLAKKISEDGSFGIILDYIDDGNFLAFVISNKDAILMRLSNKELVGCITNKLKLVEKKKAKIDLSIKSTFQKIQFYVNGMMALEARYLPLESNGIGFYVYGEQVVDFDNLQIIR